MWQLFPLKNESHGEGLVFENETERNDCFRLLWDASVKRYEALNNDGIPPAQAQSVALVSYEGSHSTLKKYRGSRNSSFYSIFCVLFTEQSILYRESPQNW